MPRDEFVNKIVKEHMEAYHSTVMQRLAPIQNKIDEGYEKHVTRITWWVEHRLPTSILKKAPLFLVFPQFKQGCEASWTTRKEEFLFVL
ncbi:hypothetical protein GOP47_0002698 [Adiantum capillus-veneris]|uniref:Uncharacterized protein n=1 Tax=Adiantum capillus-veneris TaxID=13818 RepID=A0A9D4VBF2_ADICA|nr:hypothetical protein GOP47_0002698 [Adiantum capillus-veneris]